MHCHLVIPSLFPPADAAEQVLTGLVLPALDKLLARGHQTASPAAGYEAWCCGRFGVQKQQDWPLAPVSALADGGEPGSAYWLRADPVHLQVNRDQLILGDSSTFEIELEEAEALTDALNAHFGAEGLIFEPRHPQRWYLRLPQAIDLQTTSLAEAAGRNIDPLLPTGRDARRFRSIFNEAQMLLFGHPVNENREAEGRAPVNSVWFWGGGVMPPVPRPSPEKMLAKVWADENVVRSLALACGVPLASQPANVEAWLAEARGMLETRGMDEPRGVAEPQGMAERGEQMVVLDRLRAIERYGDIDTWREAVQRMEQDWFAPLAAALQRGKISRLSLTGFAERQAIAISATRGDLWKLWRGGRSLSGLLRQ